MSDSTPANGRRLTQYIRDSGLRVGDRLPPIRELATLWECSPNVVRDSLLAAQTKGILKIHPRAGAFVQSLDFSSLVDALSDTLETALMQKDTNLLHLIQSRILIEVELVGLAAGRRRPEHLLGLRDALERMAAYDGDRPTFVEADEKFHLTIGAAAENQVLVIMLQALLGLLRPYRLNMVPTPDHMEFTTLMHETLYSSIKAGDAATARSTMERHLRRGHEAVLARLEASLKLPPL